MASLAGAIHTALRCLLLHGPDYFLADPSRLARAAHGAAGARRRRARHLAGQDGRLFRAISFRQELYAKPAIAGRLWLEVWLSSATASADQLAPSFADNRGTDHVQVFQGYVSFPAGRPASSPAPWGPRLALAMPFRYRGGPLCIEVVTKLANGSDTPQPPAWFSFDAEVRAPSSEVARYGKSCLPTMLATASAERLVVGAAGSFHLTGPARTAPQLGMLLLGGGPNNLSLDAVAPGCSLLVQMDLVLPMVFATAGFAAGTSFEIAVPLQRSLQGATLCAQWAVLDPPANRLGLRFSDAFSARIGAANSLGCAWLESADLAAKSGRLDTFFVPVMQVETAQ